jgi:hypothetical protein
MPCDRNERDNAPVMCRCQVVKLTFPLASYLHCSVESKVVKCNVNKYYY